MTSNFASITPNVAFTARFTIGSMGMSSTGGSLNTLKRERVFANLSMIGTRQATLASEFQLKSRMKTGRSGFQRFKTNS